VCRESAEGGKSIMPTRRPKSLFDVVAPEKELHHSFEILRTAENARCTRGMLEDVYQDFEDPDGNFLEQFQTTGFDSRFFELYLFAYFSRSGYQVDRSHPNPDFLVTRGDLTVAVEATTINPSTSGVLKSHGRTVAEVSPAESLEYAQNELPIRFGGPLFSKLGKRYWQLPHCRDMPFVLAIEAFHEVDSLSLSDNALMTYVFGLTTKASWTTDATLDITTERVEEHRLGPKVIPSNFFGQPDTEHISAVVFTNSGTHAKFSRMGFHHGIECDEIEMTRYGFCYTPRSDAMDPTFFSYNLDEPPFVEPWGQGLVVMHNPNSRHPVPRDYFVDAIQAYLEDGVIVTEHRSWHPYTSKTVTFYFGGAKKELAEMFPKRKPIVSVSPISRDEFQRACNNAGYGVPSTQEHGWFSDDTGSFLGVVVHDVEDNDWVYVVLARDQYFQFRAIDVESGLPFRDMAREALQLKIAQLLSSPQRIFPHEKSA
jgi:hypothetical protein